jgi:acid phosphatase
VVTTRIDGVPMYETSDGGGGLPYLGSTASYNAGDWEPALRTYVSSGNYQTQISRVDSIADRWVTHRGWRGYHKGHARHARAAHNGRGHTKPALVLDIDETSLSNYTAINADNFTFGTNSQGEATNEIGTAITPTLQVYKDALARHVAVFFITGRGEATRAHTESNLKREGDETWSKLYLKPAGTTLTTVQYKSGARKDIESQGYTIIANIGDQYSDLAGGHAQRAFKLANPFYFLP